MPAACDPATARPGLGVPLTLTPSWDSRTANCCAATNAGLALRAAAEAALVLPSSTSSATTGATLPEVM